MSQASSGRSVPAPGPEAPAPPPVDPAAHSDDRSGAGSMAALQVVASACLATTVFLPWLRWGLGASDYGYSRDLTLWAVVTESFGASSAWMALFAAGIAVAAFGAVFELAKRPMGYTARTISLAGFATSLCGAALGLGMGSATMGAYELPGIEDRTTLEFGYWLGLGLAATGMLVSIALRRMPPNPPRRAILAVQWPPLAPSVASAAAPASPDYIGHAHYPEHVGSVPPSVGPAVYPAPGFLTPAYSGPGNAGQAGWASSDWEQPQAPGVASGSGRSAGQLVVVEAGRSMSFTLQPGQRLLVGRDEDAQIRVSDPSVSFRHATIERRGHEWVVQDVDAVNPTRIVDEAGTTRPVHGETTVASAQLMLGGVRVSLYPNRPDGSV